MSVHLTPIVASGIVLFVAGILVGLAIDVDKQIWTDSNLRIAVGALVTFVWASSIAAEIFIVRYTVSPLIHGIMGGVVGYLFTEDGLSLDLGGN